MIVVDTNVIVHFWMGGEYYREANNLYESDNSWIVPVLWRSEFRNVVAFYLRRNLLTLSDALRIMNHSLLMFKGKEHSINSQEILIKISTSKLSAYDLEYVVLAEKMNVLLVTLDTKILNEFPQIAISLKNYG